MHGLAGDYVTFATDDPGGARRRQSTIRTATGHECKLMGNLAENQREALMCFGCFRSIGLALQQFEANVILQARCPRGMKTMLQADSPVSTRPTHSVTATAS